MNGTNGLKAFILGAALIASASIAGAQQGPQDHHDQDHGQQHDGRQDHGPQGYQNGQHGGGDYHFRPDDRNNLRSHYQSNIQRWQRNPQGRPHFNAGDRLPSNYRIQAVPSSYYRGVPPPPPGYRFGYYDGYVVAYNPTSRIIADVLDLVAGQ